MAQGSLTREATYHETKLRGIGITSTHSIRQECDMPDLAPNELHEDSVVRFCVTRHWSSIGEEKENTSTKGSRDFSGPSRIVSGRTD